MQVAAGAQGRDSIRSEKVGLKAQKNPPFGANREGKRSIHNILRHLFLARWKTLFAVCTKLFGTEFLLPIEIATLYPFNQENGRSRGGLTASLIISTYYI